MSREFLKSAKKLTLNSSAILILLDYISLAVLYFSEPGMKEVGWKETDGVLLSFPFIKSGGKIKEFGLKKEASRRCVILINESSLSVWTGRKCMASWLRLKNGLQYFFTCAISSLHRSVKKVKYVERTVH